MGRSIAHAELIFTGDELLRGHTLNTNQEFLGDALLGLGLLTTRAVSVPDDRGAIADELTAALDRSPTVIILSGGLGPTPDDLTREAVASALDRPLEHHDVLFDRITSVFERYGRLMSESNRKQASLPRGSTPIDFIGTAPGFWLEEGETLVAALPGPPSELRHMWDESLEPLIRSRLSDKRIVHTRVRRLRLYGLGESALAELMRDLPWRGDAVDVGTRAGYEGIDLILRASDDADGRRALAAVEAEVHRLLGRRVYGAGSDTLASVVGQLLEENGLTVATAESCTAGLVAKLLTDRPGSSSYFLGGAITYGDELKTALLGVTEDLLRKHGAVSEEVARAMVVGARRLTAAACAVSTTGIAGPEGGTPEKPVGLVYVGTAVGDSVEVKRLRLFRSREDIRNRASQTALDLLRLHLADKYPNVTTRT